SFRADKKFRLLQVEAHIKQQYVEVKDHTMRNFFIQYIPSAAISFHPFSSLFLMAHGDYVIGDYNEGDLSLKVNLSQTLGNPEGKNGGTITLKGNYAFQKPGWFYEHYLGNHFRWDTAWQKQSLVSGCFEYTFQDILTTGISISRIDHYAYLDSTIRPSQYNKEFGYIYGYLIGNLDIWRFRFAGQFAYQTIQGASVLRLPAFLGNLTVYYTQPLFHGAAILQPGLNFNYNTAYYADNYMPALRSYYLQHNKEVGNYLYMDIFVNVKIQRARFFVEYTHFNASFMGRTYYTVPSYPMQDAAFHFGIAWRFHD
ncbi:MAG TPA: putative porin, partial [Bacteroidales bacterium]|nr:putative porin [Bacteroidales bacterium]